MTALGSEHLDFFLSLSFASAASAYFSMQTVQLLTLLFRLLVGIPFLVAGWNKATDWHDFEHTLRYTFHVDRKFSPAIAKFLPFLEIFLGAALIAGLQSRFIALVMVLLLGLFLIKFLQLRLRGTIRLSCNCFGKSKRQPAIIELILRNLLLLAMALFIALFSSTFFSLWPVGPASFEILPVIAIALGCLLLASIIARVVELHHTERTARKILSSFGEAA